MEINADQQEALRAADDYISRLMPAFKELSDELKQDSGTETALLQKNCLNGLNWVIEIFNRTSAIINGNRARIDKSLVNEQLKMLSEGIRTNDPICIANAIMTGVLPFLRNLQSAISEALAESN